MPATPQTRPYQTAVEASQGDTVMDDTAICCSCAVLSSKSTAKKWNLFVWSRCYAHLCRSGRAYLASPTMSRLVRA